MKPTISSVLIVFCVSVVAMDDHLQPQLPSSLSDDDITAIPRADAHSSLDLRFEQLLLEEQEAQAKKILSKKPPTPEVIPARPRFIVTDDTLRQYELKDDTNESRKAVKHEKKAAVINSFSVPCTALADNLKKLEDTMKQYDPDAHNPPQINTEITSLLATMKNNMSQTYAQFAPCDQKALLKRAPACNMLLAHWKGSLEAMTQFDPLHISPSVKNDFYVFMEALETTLIKELQKRESF